MKKLLLSVLSLAMLLSGCAKQGKPEEETGEALLSYVLTNGFSNENEINNFALNAEAVTKLYNAKKNKFEETELTEELLTGNFVAVYDNDSDESIDVVRIVKFADANKLWDPNMTWMDGAGAAEPGISDEIGRDVYTKEYVIPYGERLLSGVGIGEYSGTVDFNNIENSTYWSNNDYYNATCNDTLTILSHYKTRLQPTGWTCGLSSALTVLEWYNQRNDLNDFDLANLRGIDKWATGTWTVDLIHVFNTLSELGITTNWKMESSEENPGMLYDNEWVKAHLDAGHPIMVDWNAFGGHWQVIIGYDDMGTEDTLDDVLIMMDPYDTTDHNNNGYELESYERLAYGVSNGHEGPVPIQYLVVIPDNDWTYEKTMGEGIVENTANEANFTDENKLSYGNSASDIQKLYPKTEYLGDNGLAGAATGGYERSGDHNHSPYWMTKDFYNLESNDTLKILTNFKTVQQTTEWTCGLASARMVMNWFGLAENETDISLGSHRQNGVEGATTLEGMKEVFNYMNTKYNQDWVYITTEDLDDPLGEESYIGDLCLQAGTDEEWYGLIPYLLENGIPMMIGSDEWGGHWQVIIGYDDMGTIDRTEDDVIIIADPYDTTDHNQDGYLIDGFERLVYGWYSSFEEEIKHNDFIVAFPKAQYEEVCKTLNIK